MPIRICALASVLAVAMGAAHGAELSVQVFAVDEKGVGAPAGSVRIVETPHGLAIYPRLMGLAPGLHGFHVHENPSCAAVEQSGRMIPAAAAGGHLDPTGTKRHG